MWPGTTSSPTQHVMSHPSLGKQQVLFIEPFVVEGFNAGLWLHVSLVSLGLKSERQKLKKIWCINRSDTERSFPLAWNGFASLLHSINATKILHETIFLLLHPPRVWRQKSRLGNCSGWAPGLVETLLSSQHPLGPLSPSPSPMNVLSPAPFASFPLHSWFSLSFQYTCRGCDNLITFYTPPWAIKERGSGSAAI